MHIWLVGCKVHKCIEQKKNSEYFWVEKTRQCNKNNDLVVCVQLLRGSNPKDANENRNYKMSKKKSLYKMVHRVSYMSLWEYIHHVLSHRTMAPNSTTCFILLFKILGFHVVWLLVIFKLVTLVVLNGSTIILQLDMYMYGLAISNYYLRVEARCLLQRLLFCQANRCGAAVSSWSINYLERKWNLSVHTWRGI